jgi:hypothetical protein
VIFTIVLVFAVLIQNFYGILWVFCWSFGYDIFSIYVFVVFIQPSVYLIPFVLYIPFSILVIDKIIYVSIFHFIRKKLKFNSFL